MLAPTFERASSTVLLSATLTPPEAIRRVLGLSARRTASISLPPPFPPENRKVLIVPTVRTTYKTRERNYGRIAELLAGMSDAHGGNDLVLFPSYRFLTEVSGRMGHHERVDLGLLPVNSLYGCRRPGVLPRREYARHSRHISEG